MQQNHTLLGHFKRITVKITTIVRVWTVWRMCLQNYVTPTSWTCSASAFLSNFEMLFITVMIISGTDNVFIGYNLNVMLVPVYDIATYWENDVYLVYTFIRHFYYTFRNVVRNMGVGMSLEIWVSVREKVLFTTARTKQFSVHDL